MAGRRKDRTGHLQRATLFAASSGAFVLVALAAALAATRPAGAATDDPSGPAPLDGVDASAARPAAGTGMVGPAQAPARGSGVGYGTLPGEGSAAAAGPARGGAAGGGPQPAAAARPTGPRPAPTRMDLAIVIDDVGHNLRQLEPFLALPFPVAFAVLPDLPYTAEAARMIRAAGKELMLHQPMEALGELDEGPGAVYRYMEPEEIKAIVRANLDQVPGAVAMNNHMGSAATGDERLARAVLEAAGERGVPFLDSLTSGDSVIQSVSISMDIPHLERDVFLDNQQDRASIVEALDEGTRRAGRKGHAVMIGHVWSAELAQTLMDLYPELVEKGFSLSTISRLMMEDLDEDPGD